MCSVGNRASTLRPLVVAPMTSKCSGYQAMELDRWRNYCRPVHRVSRVTNGLYHAALTSRIFCTNGHRATLAESDCD
jgi:hypothetical protein